MTKNAKPNRKSMGKNYGIKIRDMGLLLLVALTMFSCAGLGKKPMASEKAGPADMYMGDMQGSKTDVDGTKTSLAGQVIALGDDKYQINILKEFDTRDAVIAVLNGTASQGQLIVDGTGKTEYGDSIWRGTMKGDSIIGFYYGRKKGVFAMKKVVRLSPTIGAKPPKKAIVLFDGSDLDQWQNAKGGGPANWILLDNGAMEVNVKKGSVVTKKKFNDFKLHLEFRTPFMPKARGQARGNSGVYMQERYEVQVLDSYGLEGKDNECGGIYKVAVPRVNMCAPPLQWQTYDVVFHAPRFDKDGKKIKNAVLTVKQNGVVIHDNLEIPGPTGGAGGKNENQPDGIYLQDHHNPVQYRNIWILPLKD